jgi:hypothetical protein
LFYYFYVIGGAGFNLGLSKITEQQSQLLIVGVIIIKLYDPIAFSHGPVGSFIIEFVVDPVTT